MKVTPILEIKTVIAPNICSTFHRLRFLALVLVQKSKNLIALFNTSSTPKRKGFIECCYTYTHTHIHTNIYTYIEVYARKHINKTN